MKSLLAALALTVAGCAAPLERTPFPHVFRFQLDASISPEMEAEFRAAAEDWKQAVGCIDVEVTRQHVDTVSVYVSMNPELPVPLWAHASWDRWGGGKIDILPGIGDDALPTVLRHEIGHTFGLLHSDQGLMAPKYAGPYGIDTASIVQVFERWCL